MKYKLLMISAITILGFIGACNDKSNKDIGVGPIKEVKIASEIQVKLANKGKNIYNTKCTMCHSFEQKLVGPALSNITKKRTPEWIMNMILNPDGMTKENEVAKALLKEYNNIVMINQNLSKEDARAILEFLRQSDS